RKCGGRVHASDPHPQHHCGASHMKSQRGFTLMEVMASTMATAIVIAAASAFLLRFLAWYDELSAKIAMNRHARETYDVFSLGGLSSTSGNDGTKNVYGLRE